MSNSYSEKTDPSSIYSRFNTRYVISLFSYTNTLFEWSQMKIIKLEFPIFWYETLCLKQVYCCLTFVCVYINIEWVKDKREDAWLCTRTKSTIATEISLTKCYHCLRIVYMGDFFWHASKKKRALIRNLTHIPNLFAFVTLNGLLEQY